MRIYKTKAFNKWAKKINLIDLTLKQAIDEINRGQFEANLGKNIYKKRIAHKNKSKRNSLRTIIAFKINDKAFFIYGYAKNYKNDITDKEKKLFKKLANNYLAYDNNQIEQALFTNKLTEVKL